jgi:hypothetical protein
MVFLPCNVSVQACLPYDFLQRYREVRHKHKKGDTHRKETSLVMLHTYVSSFFSSLHSIFAMV